MLQQMAKMQTRPYQMQTKNKERTHGHTNALDEHMCDDHKRKEHTRRAAWAAEGR